MFFALCTMCVSVYVPPFFNASIFSFYGIHGPWAFYSGQKLSPWSKKGTICSYILTLVECVHVSWLTLLTGSLDATGRGRLSGEIAPCPWNQNRSPVWKQKTASVSIRHLESSADIVFHLFCPHLFFWEREKEREKHRFVAPII